MHGAPTRPELLNRPLVRIAIDVDGALVPPPGTLADLAEQDGRRQLPPVASSR